MHLLFVSVVVFLQITDYLLLKFFILDELSYFMGAAGIVLRNNDSVDTLFNLAVRRGIVGRNDRLTQYLYFILFSCLLLSSLMYDLLKFRIE